MDPLEGYLEGVMEVVRSIPREPLRQVVQAIRETAEADRTVFLLGNGGSAATASHMACDLAKGCLEAFGRPIRAIALTDNVPLMTAWANDLAYEAIFAEQLRGLVRPGDLVVALSASGNSPNVLRAMEAARAAGARTAGFTGHPGGLLKEMVDIAVVAQSRCIEQAEDAHLILNHAIAIALRNRES